MRLCKHLCVAGIHPSCSALPCDKALESLVLEMGGKPWCGAVADELIARATSYGHLWSLMFSGQWLLQALGPAKACAISFKPLFVTKLSSSIMTALDLGVSRVAEGYAGVNVSNCRKRKNTIWKISVVLKPLYPPPI